MKTVVRVLLVALLLVAACGTREPPEQTLIVPTLTSPAPTPTTGEIKTDESSPSLVLLGTLIDGTGTGPLPDAALVIQRDRIVAVGPRAEISIPHGAQIIELPQVTILPGFINMHVHYSHSKFNRRTWAQGGVTTVREVGARVNETDVFVKRDQLNAVPEYARALTAGPIVTAPRGYPVGHFPPLTVTSPEDARQKIDQLIDDGADVIKIAMESGAGPILSLETATAIVADDSSVVPDDADGAPTEAPTEGDGDDANDAPTVTPSDGVDGDEDSSTPAPTPAETDSNTDIDPDTDTDDIDSGPEGELQPPAPTTDDAGVGTVEANTTADETVGIEGSGGDDGSDTEAVQQPASPPPAAADTTGGEEIGDRDSSASESQNSSALNTLQYKTVNVAAAATMAAVLATAFFSVAA